MKSFFQGSVFLDILQKGKSFKLLGMCYNQLISNCELTSKFDNTLEKIDKMIKGNNIYEEAF